MADYITWITSIFALDTGVTLGTTDVTVGGLVVAGALLAFGFRAVRRVKSLA